MQIKTNNYQCPHCINGVRFNGEDYEPCEFCDVESLDSIIDLEDLITFTDDDEELNLQDDEEEEDD